MKWLYLSLGILLSFNLTIKLLEPLQAERDRTTVKIQSLQSCYFSAVKFAKMDPDKSSEFCEQHSKETTENYADIAKQMDEMTDQMYSPGRYYSRQVKSWLGIK